MFRPRFTRHFALGLLACALALDSELRLSAEDWSVGRAPLLTRWAKDVSPSNACPEYPRPQLVRADWMNLNGLWDFAVSTDSKICPREFTGKILAPFPIESALSGVMRPLGRDERLWCRRKIALPESWAGRRIRLHCGAIDWKCHVWVNQAEVGEHQGGYDAFTFDITPALNGKGSNTITLCITDPTEGDQPRGKQSLRPEGVFYSSSSGIWQTIWLEPVADPCIDNLKLTPDLESQSLKIRVAAATLSDDLEVELVASANGKEISRVSGLPNAMLSLPVPNPHPWTPDDPFLYDLVVTLNRNGHAVDTVSSYFGMRSFSLKRDAAGRMGAALNNRSIFQVGVLDQGFWPDGIYTAPTDEAIQNDLQFLKRSGFNLVRKHVKVEPERWYYWCDKLGLLVWQDMPSGNNITPEGRTDFEIELHRIIEQLYNHPAIIQWVLFNEGWGQYDTERLVRAIRKIDQSRLIDDAAGWTDMRVGDIVDTHSYPEPQTAEPDSQRASVLGEFGGVGFRVEGHTWSSESWGYQGVAELNGVTAWYLHLMRSVWNLKEKAGLCAAVYTQLTDVETECNGLMTYDRAVQKIDSKILRKASREMPDSSRGTVILADAQNGKTTWKYSTMTPSENWKAAEFDDSAWLTGVGGFGSPGTLGGAIHTLWNTNDIWLRRTFVIDTNVPQNLKLEMDCDDQGEIYLNGVLAARATDYLVDYVPYDISPEAFATLRPGTNTIAGHGHYTSGGQYFDVGLFDPRSGN